MSPARDHTDTPALPTPALPAEQPSTVQQPPSQPIEETSEGGHGSPEPVNPEVTQTPVTPPPEQPKPTRILPPHLRERWIVAPPSPVTNPTPTIATLSPNPGLSHNPYYPPLPLAHGQQLYGQYVPQWSPYLPPWPYPTPFQQPY